MLVSVINLPAAAYRFREYPTKISRATAAAKVGVSPETWRRWESLRSKKGHAVRLQSTFLEAFVREYRKRIGKSPALSVQQ